MIVMKGWEQRKLTDLADYINGCAFKPEDWGLEGLPIIRIEQLKNPQATTDFYAGKLPIANVINDGDLVFSWSASLFLRIWKHGKAALNQHLFKVVEKDGVDKVFLKSFIDFHLPELTKASHGSTMQHITRKELEKFSAPFPIEEKEQTKIAAILATIDQAIEQTEAIIVKQQRIKSGLMQDLLTKGIDEHGNIRSDATHDFKDSPLGRIPVGWSCQTVEKLLVDGILSDIQDGNHGEKHPKSSDFVPEGVPFVMASDIASGEIDLARTKKITETQYRRLRIGFSRPRDVLLSHKASIGFVAVVPDNVHALMLTPQVTYYRVGDCDRLSYRFLAQFFRSGKFQETLKSFAKQSTRDYIGILAQQKLHIAYPSTIVEQERITDILNGQDCTISSQSITLNKFQLIKTGLMQDLLTGKVRVTELLTQSASQ